MVHTEKKIELCLTYMHGPGDDACKAETTEKAEAGEEDKANFSQAPALSSQGCSQG